MRHSIFSKRFAFVETVEPRLLLAGDGTIELDGSILQIRGTEQADVIRLDRVGFDDVRVTLNSTVRVFDMDDVLVWHVVALGGNDTITKVGILSGAVAPGVSVDGGAGNDTVTGSDFGVSQVETVKDPAGRVVATRDADGKLRIHGTAGNDDIRLNDFRDGPFIQVNADFQANFASSSYPAFVAVGGAGNDRLTVGELFARPVQLYGDGAAGENVTGNDFFDVGRFNTAEVFGGSGDDTLRARDEDFSQILDYDGGDGADAIQMDQQTSLDLSAFFSVENVTEAQGTIVGTNADNRITARFSDTAGITVNGRDGDDTIVGAAGPDKLFGEADQDTLIGNGGNDLLDGGEGFDFLDGGAGTNTLTNGEFRDGPKFFLETPGTLVALTAYGTPGNDTVNVQRVGIDDVRVTINGTARVFDMDDFDEIMIYGGPGNDTFTAGAGVAELFLFGGAGDDRLTGNELTNVLSGNDGNDMLIGNGGDDYLGGDNGNDSLSGGSGEDILDGDLGNDTLDGGLNPDTMNAGDGNDTIFARDSTRDGLVQGGPGFDKARVDAVDDPGGIEQFLA